MTTKTNDLMQKFKETRQDYLKFCKVSAANTQSLNVSRAWFKELDQAVKKVCDDTHIKTECLERSLPVMAEIPLSELESHYRQDHPACVRLGWQWIGKLKRYLPAYETQQQISASSSKKRAEFYKLIQSLEADFKKLGQKVPTDRNLGIA